MSLHILPISAGKGRDAAAGDPISARRSATPPRSPGGGPARNVGLGHVAARLGRPESETVATTIGFVRDLIRHKGFPEPLGFRRWRGELVRGADAVTAASRWPAAAVDAWFDNTFPAHSEAALAADEREWAENLDGAAGRLSEVA